MGPLEGIKIIELAGIGPCPMCGMLLAELGADVLKIDRVRPSGLGLAVPAADAFLHRSRRSIALDLKRPEAAPLVLRLCEHADALIEGKIRRTPHMLG